jgi:uncharacterized protein (TIGR02300 family)
MTTEQIDLGHKRTCPCGSVKYYDFYQDDIDCPECGKSIESVNIAKPKRGRKAGVTIAATPSKTNKDNDELKDLIEETDDNAASPGEDTENLAEDITIDIPKDKNEDTN